MRTTLKLLLLISVTATASLARADPPDLGFGNFGEELAFVLLIGAALFAACFVGGVVVLIHALGSAFRRIQRLPPERQRVTQVALALAALVAIVSIAYAPRWIAAVGLISPLYGIVMLVRARKTIAAWWSTVLHRRTLRRAAVVIGSIAALLAAHAGFQTYRQHRFVGEHNHALGTARAQPLLASVSCDRVEGGYFDGDSAAVDAAMSALQQRFRVASLPRRQCLEEGLRLLRDLEQSLRQSPLSDGYGPRQAAERTIEQAVACAVRENIESASTLQADLRWAEHAFGALAHNLTPLGPGLQARVLLSGCPWRSNAFDSVSEAFGGSLNALSYRRDFALSAAEWASCDNNLNVCLTRINRDAPRRNCTSRHRYCGYATASQELSLPSQIGNDLLHAMDRHTAVRGLAVWFALLAQRADENDPMLFDVAALRDPALRSPRTNQPFVVEACRAGPCGGETVLVTPTGWGGPSEFIIPTKTRW